MRVLMTNDGNKWGTADDVLVAISNTIEFTDIGVPKINQKGICGNTPLKVSVVWGDVAATNLLIKAGADVNAKNEDGFTALHHAAVRNSEQLVQLLLDAGADPTIANVESRLPAGLATNEQVKNLLNCNA